MANILTAGNSSNGGTAISTDTSGTLNIVTGSGSGSNAITIDGSQNVSIPKGVGGTPAFSAYLGTNQTLSSGIYTKVQLNTERFDTNNNFDPTTNYRFTPTVAGYYQINYQVYATSTATTSGFVGALYKNGTVYEYGLINSATVANQAYSSATLVYMNGTTDYLELYINLTGTGTLIAAAASGTTNFMSGFLARGV
jgi:hypothetical protein